MVLDRLKSRHLKAKIGLLIWGFTLAAGSLAHAGKPNSCVSLMELVTENQPYEALPARYLAPSELQSRTATLFFKGLRNDGRVVFRKLENSVWYSRFEYRSGSLTPQGDVRYPIFILGAPLAERFGFRISENQDGSFEVLAPGADSIGLTVRKVNAQLKKMKKKPIRYLPVKSGFVDSVEMLEFSLKPDPEIWIFFPYEDNDPTLTAHEVSFHLGAMVFPEFLMEHIYKINLQVFDLVRYLRSHSDKIGPQTETLARTLLKNRATILDVNTGNMTSALAKWRSGLVSSSQALEGITGMIEKVARPRQSPLVSAISLVADEVGLPTQDILGEDQGTSEWDVLDRFYLRSVYLTPDYKDGLKQVLTTYFKENKKKRAHMKFEPESADPMAREILYHFENRIRELTEAFDKASDPT